MSSKTVIIYTDDLDGSEVKQGKGGPVSFSVDGVDYIIDLTDKNKAQFLKVMQPYIDAGTKLRKGGRTKKATAVTDAKEVRLWGQSNGFEVPERGRIPQEVWDAYSSNQ